MKFILAPDKYKGSLSGPEFCEIVEKGIRKIFPRATIIKRPLADGGDGTLDVIHGCLATHFVGLRTRDPLHREIEAHYLLSDDGGTAYIEMARASGHKLLQVGELNCMESSSYGTGLLLVDALDKGVRKIVLGLGGTATNDGGMGMAAALGCRFLDPLGTPLEPMGRNLSQVAKIETDGLHRGLRTTKIQVACDVTNPFYGPSGTARTYAAQKGAGPQEVELLERGMEHFAGLIQKQFGIDLQKYSGSGAAGGVAGGALALLKAELVPGTELVMELCKFDQVLEGAQWVITGEGQLDKQTLSGKTLQGVLREARKKGIPVAAFCGSIVLSIAEINRLGLAYAVSILNQVGDLEHAKANSQGNLELAAYNFARLLRAGGTFE